MEATTTSGGSRLSVKETHSNEGPSRGSSEPGKCEILVQMVKNHHSFEEYTEDFLDKAKRCNPKPAEKWCRLYKVELSRDIRGQLEWCHETSEVCFGSMYGMERIAAAKLIADMIVDNTASSEPEENPSEDKQK